jgi:hypothetical protein
VSSQVAASRSIKAFDILGKAGFKVRDLKSGCCGLAGTAGMQQKNRDLAGAIGKPLKEAIERERRRGDRHRMRRVRDADRTPQRQARGASHKAIGSK